MFTRRLARSTASVICFFRVLAIVPTYNKEDIIERTIEVLIQQGLDLTSSATATARWSAPGLFFI
jgi:hypothetical protein